MARRTEAAPAPPAPDDPADRVRGKHKRVNLALQGGGSHGAFTWGVCERLLEEPRLDIDSISGTSAGAMNGAVLAAGFAQGGRQGAIAALDAFWRAIAEAGAFSLIQRSWWDKLVGNFRLDASPAYAFLDLLNRVLSPYQLNPAGVHPLRPILERQIDFDMLRHSSPIRLHVGATNVRTGKVKVFSGAEVTVDALLASACLPFMFKAVRIDGEIYWDGGYMGNPAIFPLAYQSDCQDVVIVQINPLRRDEEPTTAREIIERVNEISFNSTLMREMRAIHFVARLVDAGKLDPAEYKKLHVHMIETDALKDLGASSKLTTDLAFLLHLRGLGRQVAGDWLDASFAAIGERSTVDLAQVFL
ncbi:MAG: patatin-like phospholipase family protein [Alphaproteobacteria bacterium]|nr:patatin-like phospholipase family protein [Alphaproteobacteria bacterium]